jgi:hypothetical protein
MIAVRCLRWALKVESEASSDCSSPMSAKTSSKHGSRVSGPTGAGMPLCTMSAQSASALSSTVLPPVFGPETSRVRSSGAIASVNGTTAMPCASSSGWRPSTTEKPSTAATSSASWHFAASAYRARP